MDAKSKSKTQTIILILLLLAGAIYVAYSFYLSPLSQELTQIKTQNEALKSELAELQPYQDNRELYTKKIRENNERIIELVDCMPNNVNQKSILAYFYNATKENSLESPSLVYDRESEVNQLAYSFDNDRDSITLIERNVSLGYSISYDNFKKYVKTVQDSGLDMCIDNVSLSFDNTSNKITGTIALKAHAVAESSNTGVKYDTSNIKTGVDNVFGTYSEEQVQPSIATDEPEASLDESVSNNEESESISGGTND